MRFQPVMTNDSLLEPNRRLWRNKIRGVGPYTIAVAVPELSGVAVVGLGSFNPAIIHPQWLLDKELIPQNAAEHALQPGAPQQTIVTSQLAAFLADWLSVQVLQEQAVFSTVDAAREPDLRSLAIGIFELLPETPVNAIGINSDTHFRVESQNVWHKFGDRFLPKDFWEPLFDGSQWKSRGDGNRVGMRSMTVEVHRADESQPPGWVRVEVAPSIRVVPNGVYVAINAHFQLTTKDRRGTGRDASRLLRDNWESTRSLEAELLAHVLDAV